MLSAVLIWFAREGKSSANGSAWPVANPVLTCASATDAGYPSNFVADPFLYLQVRSVNPVELRSTALYMYRHLAKFTASGLQQILELRNSA